MANTNAMCGVKIYLDRMAELDPAFAIKYHSGEKTLRGAITYLAAYNQNNTNVEYRLKDIKLDKGKCDFVDTNDDADNQLAYNYFMDDTLNYEKAEKPKNNAKAEKKAQENIAKAVSDFSPTISELESIGAYGEAPKAKPQKPAKTAKPKTAKPKVVQKPLPEEENIFDSLFD